jgi:ABC-2 type transport system ATP-binding protein
LTFPATTSAAPLVSKIAAGYPLVDLSISDPTIESIIARLYATTV